MGQHFSFGVIYSPVTQVKQILLALSAEPHLGFDVVDCMSVEYEHRWPRRMAAL
jgi:hypothetical protein